MVETLPVFPLGTVLLPGASLPLHIFEPRYRQLTIDLVTGALPGKQFGVVAVRDGWNPDDGREGLHEVGCTALLREVRRLPDGRFDIQTTGDRRFRLVDLDDSTAPYLVANVEWLPDDDTDRDYAALATAARAAHRRYCTTAWHHRGSDVDDGVEDVDDGCSPGPEDQDAPDVADAELAHVLAGDCLLPLQDRQELLEQRCPLRRLDLVRRSMLREAMLLGTLKAVWAPTAKFAVEHSLN